MADTEEERVHRRTWLGRTISRRSILTTTPLAAAAGSLALVSCTEDGPGAHLPEGDITVPDRPVPPPPDLPQSLRFFTAEEALAIEAAAARLIPGTEEDPGAVQAGVVFYIDAKLAEHETYAEPTYQAGPFANTDVDGVPGIEVEEDELYRYGNQSPLTPREIYHLGVPALDRYSQTRFGSLFHLLPENRQDEVLAALDAVQQRTQPGDLPAGEAEDSDEGAEGDLAGAVTNDQMDQAEDIFGDLDPGLFFTTLRTDTIEGMFADPAYGGNRGMVGWALLGYPGAQRSYSPHEMMHGARRTPQPMHQLTAMNPDRPGGGHPALEQHDGRHVGG